MQAVTAYSNQGLKTTDGGGEERGKKRKTKSKPHLTSFQQQNLCELQDPDCKFRWQLWIFGENCTSLAGYLPVVCRNFSDKLHYPEWQTKSKLPPMLPACWEVWVGNWEISGLGVGLEPLCFVVLFVPLSIWVSECKPFAGSENPATSASPVSEQRQCNPTGRLCHLGAKQRS